jgi:hypothetical protein
MTDPIAAARLTLLVAATSSSGANRSSPDRRFILRPGAGAVTAGEAAELLAGMAKPVRCHPDEDGSSIALHCASEPAPTTDTEREAAANHCVARSALLGPLPGWANDAAGRALVVVRSETDSLTVSVATIREWRADYIIVQNHTIMFADDGDGHSVAGTFTVIGNIAMLRSGQFRHG